jgi:transcriptional regulator with XRE-family HTH domain
MPPRTKVTPEEIEAREKRALEWAEFRQTYKFTQTMLADTLKSIDVRKTGKCKGISRRTVQQIEGALISPHAHTLELFAELKSRHEKNKEK